MSNKIIVAVFTILSFAACEKAVVGRIREPSPGADGAAGVTGEPGVAGAQGAQGPAGAAGIAPTVEDILTAVIPFLPAGPHGVAGLPGLNGAQGIPGDVGATGAAGERGPQGANGVGFSNTSVLSAVRTFSPTTDYPGATTVNTSAIFVPSVLNVVVGEQKIGLAYVSFGSTKCTYTGNNKSGAALALYEFTDCRDADDNILDDKRPGTPFAFTGTVTLTVGPGSGEAAPVQVVSFLQVQ